nr:retinol dehydrogenase 7-like [Rhipicephalus microplus]
MVTVSQMTLPTAAISWLLSWQLPHQTLELVTAAALAALAVFVSYWTLWQIRRRFLNAPVEAQGKSVLITGCDTGLGYLLAKQLAADGFYVYAGCLSATGEGAKILRTKTNIEVLQMDVTKDHDAEAAYEAVERTLVRFQVNTFGVVRVARAFLPLLRKTPGSRLVIVTSLLGRMSMPASMTYCMSKHASTSLADSLRRQYYDRGVHISTVEPGAYRTPMANHDTMAETLRKDLSLLPARVRSGISDHSLGSLRKSSDVLYSSIMRDDSQEAVNVMKSAVRDLVPKVYYRAGGLEDILLRRLYEVVPAEVTDEVVHMIRKVARAARRKA